jgi:hypothetical protein
MMHSSVLVLGAGLTGCLTASKLSQLGHHVVLADTSNTVLSSFSSIDINGILCNRGFYALELPRAKPVGDFFTHQCQLPSKTTPQRRMLLINRDLIDENAPINEWPLFVRNSVRHTVEHYRSLSDCELDIDDQYLDLLRESSWRYEPWSIYKSQAIPWFLPHNITIESNDEGDRFRTLVRQKINNEYILQPCSGFFSDLIPLCKDYLLSLNVHLLMNFTADLTSMELLHRSVNHALSDQSQDLEISSVVFCAASESILSQIKIDQLRALNKSKSYRLIAVVLAHDLIIPPDVTQVLVNSSVAPDLARISFCPPQRIKPKSDAFYLALEFLTPPSSSWTEDDLFHQAREIFKPLASRIDWLGCKELGVRYVPTQDWIAQSNQLVQEHCSSNLKGLIHIPHFGPINMAKAATHADRICSMIRLQV